MKHLTQLTRFRAAGRWPAALLLIGFLLLLPVASTLALTWNTETVDSIGSAGLYTSLALDPATGAPRISYYNATNDDLKYAAWDGTSWVVEIVDSGGNVGWDTSLALDTAGKPRISYYDATNDDLKYAAWDGTSWVVEIVDSGGDVGRYTSLALDAAGKPRISYYDFTNFDLKYAAWDGTSWVVEIVDSGGNVGWDTSLALDAAGKPRISYYDATNFDLKYAAWDGTSWVVEAVDSGGVVGEYTSLALDAAGKPRISYYDATNDDLKYAAWDGTSWVVEVVDSGGEVGRYTSLALDAAGKPRISYDDFTNFDLKYAAWDGTSWVVETVDSGGVVGAYTSLALDGCDNPRISYHDSSNSDLKYTASGGCAAALTITKTMAGAGAPIDWSFAFTGDLGAFNLTDEAPSTTDSDVTPGTVAINETNPAGYATSAACDNGASATDGNLSLTLAAGDNVSCTFTNTICQPGRFDTATTWACAPADPGYYVATVGASAQTACVPGTYQPSAGAFSCIQAAPGHYVPAPAATASIACAPGTYQPTPGLSFCILADAGFYATGPAATEQTACPADTTSPSGSDSVDDCVSTAPDVYMSTITAGTTADGLAFGPEDIIKWDGSAWSMWFDGSAAGLTPNSRAKHNINALWIPDTAQSNVVMSFGQNRRHVPDIAQPVDGMDLVSWDGSAFSFWFDGSDVDLTSKTQEKIDALHVLDGSESPINGGNCLAYLLISTQGPGKVRGYDGAQIKFSGEDVLGFCATALGENTAGLWHMVLDGSAEGMPRNSTNSISLSADGRTLWLTTRAAFNVDAAAGGHSMVYAWDFATQTFSGPVFIAADYGLSKRVDGLQMD